MEYLILIFIISIIQITWQASYFDGEHFSHYHETNPLNGHTPLSDQQMEKILESFTLSEDVMTMKKYKVTWIGSKQPISMNRKSVLLECGAYTFKFKNPSDHNQVNGIKLLPLITPSMKKNHKTD